MWPDDPPPGFLKGWNQSVQRYNDNFYSGLQDRIDNPKLLLNDLSNAANGLMNLAADVSGISNIVTGENQTAQALSGTISTLTELPKMSSEERGAVAAGIGIAITEMALTRKLPLGELKALPKGNVPNAGGYIRSFTTETSETYFRVYSNNPSGAYLTKVAPKSSAFAREGLALPSTNSASFIQKVTVPEGVVLQRSRALPVPEWGRRGGLEQFEILNKDSRIVYHPGVPFK